MDIETLTKAMGLQVKIKDLKNFKGEIKEKDIESGIQFKVIGGFFEYDLSALDYKIKGDIIRFINDITQEELDRLETEFKEL
jgi:hypothetical protein